MKIKLQNVRIAFAELFTPKSVNGEGEPAFSASFLFAPDHPCVAELNKAIEATAKDKWGAKAGDILKQLRAGDKICLHNGDSKEYDGYAGNLFVAARNKTRPGVFDRDRTPLGQTDGKPYSGCYVKASLELWAQENAYGKRINATLAGVQFVRDGDAFAGGRSATEEDFDDLSTEAETADSLV